MRPRSRIADSVKAMFGVASAWIVMPSAPALANSADVALGALDHEVHVEVRVVGQRLAQRGDDHRAEGDRRDEVAVHDVAVDDAAARVHDLAHLGGEIGEVGRQDRRRDMTFGEYGQGASQISRSIEAEHALQDRIAVFDMRTIVECSPQSGHSEHSSKRCRQYTQR